MNIGKVFAVRGALCIYIRELLGGVDARGTGAVEVVIAETVRIVVAPVGVTLSVESFGGVGASTFAVAVADVVGIFLASVRGEGVGVSVGLPV